MAQATCSIPACLNDVAHVGLCRAHYKRLRRYGDPLGGTRAIQDPDPKVRFFWRVDKNGPIPAHRPDLGECWLWTGQKTEQGYGRLRLDPQSGHREMAHRLAWEWEIGPIPDGMVPDHLCRNPPCVRVSHLEVVTVIVNTMRGMNPMAINARKTHCPQGHPYDEANTKWYQGRRYCRGCARDRGRKTKPAAA